MARRRRQRPPAPAVPALPQPLPAPVPGGLSLERQAWTDLGREVWNQRLLLLALLAAALALRFFRLGHSEVWLDEVLVFEDALAGTNRHISTSHRLHLTAVGWFLNHLGATPFWLRTWGALLGSLAVPVLGVAGLWLGGRRMGWACGVLAALHPFLVFYSQDANYYGGMTFFAAVQVACFVAFFRGAPLAGLTGIAAAGALSFLNHPFSILFSGLAAGGCVLGSLVYPTLRRAIYRLDPREWPRSPAVPLVAIALLLAGPALSSGLTRALDIFQARLSVGDPPGNVEFTWRFFNWVATCYGVTYFRNELPVARALAWIPTAFWLGGLGLLAMRTRHNRPSLPVAGLSLLAVVAGLLAVFNLRHHGFYPRYLTFVIPAAIPVVATACLALGDALARHRQMFATTGFAILLAVQLPFLGWYLFADRANFRSLAQVLERDHQPGDSVWAIARVESYQTDFYFGRSSAPPSPRDVRLWGFYGRYDAVIRGAISSQLAGRDTVWLISSWRWADRPALWGFLASLGPPHFAARSPHGPRQDALLYRWTTGRRIFHPTAATAPEDASGPWYVVAPGRWRVVETGQEFSFARPGFVQPDMPARPLRIEPIYDEVVRIGPFDQIDLPDDQRHEEAVFQDLPVFRRRYDGPVSHLVWIPEAGTHHLVLKVVQRTAARLAEETGRDDPDPDLLLAVAANGVHMGIWRLPAGPDERLVSLPLDVALPPGNNRIDVHGTTQRLGYTPDNPWMWAGLEVHAGRPTDPWPRWDQLDAIRIVPFPQPMLNWGWPGTTPLDPRVVESGASYHRSVPGTVSGPSGAPALVVDLDAPTRGRPNAYHFLLAPRVPAEGNMLAFSTYLRLEGTDTHAVALAAGYFDEHGALVHLEIGHQQLMVAPLTFGWRRFVEVIPVPAIVWRDGVAVPVASVAPGVLVFPPDPQEARPAGKVHVDAIAHLLDARGPFAEPALAPLDMQPALGTAPPSR